MPLETRIYERGHSIRPMILLRQSLSDIYKSRFLSKQLAVRDIKSQYRQSYLGIIWAFITPLTTAFVWIFLNSTGTISLTDTGVPYPLYAFTGTLLWSVIKDSIGAPMSSTGGARSLLSKINFPKEALIISGIYKLLFNSSVKMILLILFVIYYGVGLNWSLLLFPFAVIGIVLCGTTIGLFITPLGLLYNDVGKLINFALGFLMYTAPIVYVIPKDGIMRTIMELNPMTYLITTARDLAIGFNPEFLVEYLIVVGCSVPFFFIGLLFYRGSIPIIVERLNS